MHEEISLQAIQRSDSLPGSIPAWKMTSWRQTVTEEYKANTADLDDLGDKEGLAWRRETAQRKGRAAFTHCLETPKERYYMHHTWGWGEKLWPVNMTNPQMQPGSSWWLMCSFWLPIFNLMSSYSEENTVLFWFSIICCLISLEFLEFWSVLDYVFGWVRAFRYEFGISSGVHLFFTDFHSVVVGVSAGGAGTFSRFSWNFVVPPASACLSGEFL